MKKKDLLLNAAVFNVKSLLTVSSDAKTIKGETKGFLTGIMYLNPDDKLCPASKAAGCRDACLVSAGRAAIFQAIPKARQAKTDFFHSDRSGFMALLCYEIKALVKKAEKNGMIPAVRLNGTSDIDWSTTKQDGKTVFELFPAVQFYDYTKRKDIIRKSAKIKNWHITASYSGHSFKYASAISAQAKKYGVNLAVVFDQLPEYWKNQKVLNGDSSDLRFLDGAGIVGLRAKGAAKKDNSGFVVRTKNAIAIN